MIADLAQIISSSMQKNNGNYGKNGNPAREVAPIHVLQHIEQCPATKNETGTTAVIREPLKIETGTADNNVNDIKQEVMTAVPEVPAIETQKEKKDASLWFSDINDPALEMFVCRACGSSSWRQGIQYRVCVACQVPETQRRLGKPKR